MNDSFIFVKEEMTNHVNGIYQNIGLMIDGIYYLNIHFEPELRNSIYKNLKVFCEKSVELVGALCADALELAGAILPYVAAACYALWVMCLIGFGVFLCSVNLELFFVLYPCYFMLATVLPMFALHEFFEDLGDCVFFENGSKTLEVLEKYGFFWRSFNTDS